MNTTPPDEVQNAPTGEHILDDILLLLWQAHDKTFFLSTPLAEDITQSLQDLIGNVLYWQEITARNTYG